MSRHSLRKFAAWVAMAAMAWLVVFTPAEPTEASWAMAATVLAPDIDTGGLSLSLAPVSLLDNNGEAVDNVSWFRVLPGESFTVVVTGNIGLVGDKLSAVLGLSMAEDSCSAGVVDCSYSFIVDSNADGYFGDPPLNFEACDESDEACQLRNDELMRLAELAPKDVSHSGLSPAELLLYIPRDSEDGQLQLSIAVSVPKPFDAGNTVTVAGGLVSLRNYIDSADQVGNWVAESFFGSDLIMVEIIEVLPYPLAAGDRYSLYAVPGMGAYATGYNNNGQLGDDTVTQRTTPVEIMPRFRAVDVAMGIDHALYVLDDGRAVAAGLQSYGRLGNGVNNGANQSRPGLVGMSPTTRMPLASASGAVFANEFITSAEAGYEHSLFLTDSQKVWGVGNNGNGQLCDGTTSNRTGAPVPAGYAGGSPYGKLTTRTSPDTTESLADQNIVAISAGQYHSFLLDDQGRVWACGRGDSGQLGQGATTFTNSTPLIVGRNPTTGAALASANGSGEYFADQFIVAIAAGPADGGVAHSVFIDSYGRAWAVGDNTYGELGDGTTVRRTVPQLVGLSAVAGQVGNLLVNSAGVAFPQVQVVSVAVGRNHSLFAAADGSVWSLGLNNYGQLGTGDTRDSTYGTALTNPNFARPVQVTALEGRSIVKVSAGRYHSVFLDSTGIVWSTGNNSEGGLANGNQNRQVSPVQARKVRNIVDIDAGYYGATYLQNDGTAWAVGRNNRSQLGDGRTNNRSTPFAVIRDRTIVVVDAGFQHSALLTDEGEVWMVGLNTNGQLGDGTTTTAASPIQVLEDKTIIAVSAGAAHTLFLTSTGEVYASGLNGSGQLGNGTTVNTNSQTTAYGSNRYLPSRVGVDPLSGNALVNAAGDVFANQRIVAVAAGGGTSAANTFSLFLDEHGWVWAVGNNAAGQLGDGTTSNRSIPQRVGFSPTGSPLTLGGMTFAESGIADIAAGSNFALFLDTLGRPWGVGNNSAGQLGDGATGNLSTPYLVGHGAPTGPQAGLPLANAAGEVFADQTITAMAAGISHALFLDDTGRLTGDFTSRDHAGRLWATGQNTNGALGDGTTTNRTIPQRMGAAYGTGLSVNDAYSEQTITALAAGSAHSLMLDESCRVWAVGTNANGQLGISSTANQPVPVLMAPFQLGGQGCPVVGSG